MTRNRRNASAIGADSAVVATGVASRPRALDLFCGAGGVTRGLQLAGFYVVGVDLKRSRNYCGDEFHQADALTFPVEGYDLVWASPPCQAHSVATNIQKHRGAEYVSLIAAARERLSSVPNWVIENVPGAPLARGSLRLCGLSWGLPLLRHRYFECSRLLIAPPHVRHSRGMAVRGEVFTVAGNPGARINCHKDRPRAGGSYPLANKEQAQRALGIDWMSRKEMSQAIPPAYSRFIGEQFLRDGLISTDRDLTPVIGPAEREKGPSLVSLHGERPFPTT